MTIEGVPDIPMFRQNTAGFVHEMDGPAISNVDGDSTYVRVQVLTNAGALDRDKQLAVVSQFTDLVATAAGDPTLSERTWVLLTEAIEGGWGLGGHANTNEELVAAARAQIAAALGRQIRRWLIPLFGSGHADAVQHQRTRTRAIGRSSSRTHRSTCSTRQPCSNLARSSAGRDEAQDLRVAVFASAHPDFYMARHDLSDTNQWPSPRPNRGHPFIDSMLRMNETGPITIATIRGRVRGGGVKGSRGGRIVRSRWGVNTALKRSAPCNQAEDSRALFDRGLLHATRET